MALALASLVLVLSLARILLGGSLRKGGRWGEEAFFRRVREGVRSALNGYVQSPALTEEGIERYILAPALGTTPVSAGRWRWARKGAIRFWVRGVCPPPSPRTNSKDSQAEELRDYIRRGAGHSDLNDVVGWEFSAQGRGHRRYAQQNNGHDYLMPAKI